MKRKIITAILAITVVFSAASCGTAGSKSSNIQSNTQEAVSDTQNSTESTSETAGDTQSEETAATVKDDEKVSGSGTSKSDTTASSSADSKDADSTVKKKSSDSKNSAKNSTSTAVKHNSTQSTGASNAGTKTNKAADSSTAASNTTSQGESECTHKWVKYVSNTIQHKEEGHYETKVVKAAYDEPQYDWHNVCNKCGKDLGTDDWNVINHGDICDGSYSCIQVQVGTIHHDAETTQVWVVDKPAYTEYVYGEKCSVCGATK
jgi:hypothetical protein